MEIVENQLVCTCKKVTLSDIENALFESDTFKSVEERFKDVQKVTHCSTGCGGCHDKIMDLISLIISG
jgi:NAD(P)H-nitrite reductase large subunit